MIRPPSADILRAFGVAGSVPLALEGGQGVTFRAGDLALKPCEDAEQAEWLGSVMEAVREEGCRIARPIRSTSGSFVFDGWCATRWIEGTSAIKGRWNEAIEACKSFRRALMHVPWSPALERLNNPYAQADAAVWSGDPLESVSLGPAGDRLHQLLQPVRLSSQLVHGDLSEGNLLFLQDQSPGIIDLAPYWHPAEYALAVLIADGIAWSGAPLSLLADLLPLPEMEQMLARAVLFRLRVGFLRGESGHERAYAPVIEAVEKWALR